MGLDQPLHILILLLIIALIFGARRLPELGRSLGEGMRGFKESLSGQTPEQQAPALNAQQAPPVAPAAPAAPVQQQPVETAQQPPPQS
jgi:sec-independent protein translocase protein TatA